MSQNPAPAAEPVLDPVSRLSEILFGLIMTLTFTGTFSVASAGSESVRQLLIAAVGCNLAWGLTDAIIYLIRSLCERGHSRLLLHRLHALPVKDSRAHAEVVAALPPAMRKLLTPDEIALKYAARPDGSGLALVFLDGPKVLEVEKMPYFGNRALDGLWDDPRL